MNVARHDSDLAFIGCDQAGAVGTNQGRTSFPDFLVNTDHIQHRNTLGDRSDHLDTGIHRFEDRISSEGRRHKNHAGSCVCLLNRLFHRIEDRQPFDFLAPFAWRHSTDHLGAVIEAATGVEGTRAAGNALANNPRLLVDQNAHFRYFPSVVIVPAWLLGA